MRFGNHMPVMPPATPKLLLPVRLAKRIIGIAECRITQRLAVYRKMNTACVRWSHSETVLLTTDYKRLTAEASRDNQRITASSTDGVIIMTPVHHTAACWLRPI
ncbi:hypothetical protein KCP69_17460 [Salmonella enterica subsp. enterica]|nr:hypothetical protein KCP69_17460 [Salmonella enterica subsp. enterica]